MQTLGQHNTILIWILAHWNDTVLLYNIVHLSTFKHIVHRFVCGTEKRDIHPTLEQCWASVADDGPTLNADWANVSCVAGLMQPFLETIMYWHNKPGIAYEHTTISLPGSIEGFFSFLYYNYVNYELLTTPTRISSKDTTSILST